MTDKAEIPPGAEEVGGALYMRDAKGRLTPIELVKPKDRMEDMLVREMMTQAESLNAQMAAFRTDVFAQVDAFVQLLFEAFKAQAGGPKGNMTLQTFDGLLKLQIQISDLVKFGPELQIAKALVDECVTDWSTGARAELRAIVMNAFRADKEGQVNKAALLGLQKLAIEDERWLKAMDAIRESIEVVGTKRYFRLYRRSRADAPWQAVSLDMATV